MNIKTLIGEKNIKKPLLAIVLMLIIGAIAISVFMIKVVGDQSLQQQLIIGRSNDAIGLDPAITTDLESFQVTANIYETLVKTDINGIDLIPGLAESWDVSEDGLTFVFKLHSGITFHDNSVFNADAVVFNFNRWRDKESPYHTGHFTYWNQSFGGDPGMIKSVAALSEDTVEIVLNEPYTPFLNVLSMPPFAIASPTAIIKYNENLKSHPVGTGPYQLESWEDSGVIKLSRYDAYWKDQGTIRDVVFQTLDEDDDYLTMLAENKLNIVTSIDEADSIAIESLANVEVRYLPFLNISYLALNNAKAPFNKLAVRQAIALAIDKDAMIKDSYDLMSRSAYSFLPPILDGYDEGFKNSGKDLVKARELMAQAGYPNGFNTRLWVMDQPRNYLPYPDKVAMNLQKQLALIGINVEVTTIEWGVYTEQLRSGGYDMALTGWQGDFVDPDNFLFTMFYSDNTDEGTVLNYAYYNNAKVNGLLRKGRRVADVEFRASIYRDIQDKLFEDMASIPLSHTMAAYGVSENVLNFDPSISGVFDIRSMQVEEGMVD